MHILEAGFHRFFIARKLCHFMTSVEVFAAFLSYIYEWGPRYWWHEQKQFDLDLNPTI